MDAMKALTMVTVCVLLIGGTPVLFSGTNTADTESIQGTEGEYFVLDKKLKDSQIEIIAEYSDSVLARADSEMVDKLSREHEIDRLKGRNKIHIKDYSFDIREGPEIPEELKIEGYESDEEGMYLLHMIGPVHPDWREKLIEEGVEIFNYIPNYSYHVKMTPEEKRSVSGLEFVDWIDPYHPAYKIPKDLETGKVIVSSYSGEANRMISHRSDVDILDLQMGADLVLEVDKMSTIEELARMKEVIHLSEYVKPGLDSEVGSQIIGGGVWVHDDDGDPTTPYRVYDDHGALVNQLGYNGSDVTVAIADTGLGNGNMTGAGHEDFEGRIIGGKGYGSADGWGDGRGHGTHTAGLMAGDTYRGTGEKYEGFGPYYASQALASNSSMYVEKIFLDNGNPAGFDYYSLLEDAKKNASAYVHSNSWGASSYGHYSYSDSTYDRAVRDSDSTTEGNQPMVISVSAGNNGKEQSTGSPGNAKNVITVGATETYMPDARSYGNLGGDYDNPDMIADFSSRGWTVDNRVKPTLVAPGDGTLSTHTPELDHSNLYGLYSRDERYEWCSGTSQSAPTVSGASAVVVDWYEQNHGEKPSPSMVKALMINTAYDLDDENGNTGPVPNKKEGWGMVDLVPIVEPKTNRELIDQESLLTTGDEDTYLYQYDDESEPMNLTLTWTDVEAETDDNVTLKNDLDLKVIGPDGDLVYKGNAFDRDDDSLSDSGYTYPNTD
ncbi:MAG: S8 family serine peptidase, partial [Candidatus Saliniplasma sp.]